MNRIEVVRFWILEFAFLCLRSNHEASAAEKLADVFNKHSLDDRGVFEGMARSLKRRTM